MVPMEGWHVEQVMKELSYHAAAQAKVRGESGSKGDQPST